MKRWRSVRALPGQLVARYGKPSYDSPSILYAWGGAGAAKSDGHFLSNVFEGERYVPVPISDIISGKSRLGDFVSAPSLLAELEARGYDLTTLIFKIEQKKP
jgi:hypothetical protein